MSSNNFEFIYFQIRLVKFIGMQAQFRRGLKDGKYESNVSVVSVRREKLLDEDGVSGCMSYMPGPSDTKISLMQRALLSAKD